MSKEEEEKKMKKKREKIISMHSSKIPRILELISQIFVKELESPMKKSESPLS